LGNNINLLIFECYFLLYISYLLIVQLLLADKFTIRFFHFKLQLHIYLLNISDMYFKLFDRFLHFHLSTNINLNSVQLIIQSNVSLFQLPFLSFESVYQNLQFSNFLSKTSYVILQSDASYFEVFTLLTYKFNAYICLGMICVKYSQLVSKSIIFIS